MFVTASAREASAASRDGFGEGQATNVYRHLLGVGIEPRRAHWVIRDRVTFPRAPLQSRTVGFPESGFRLGFSPRGLSETR